MRVVVGSVYIVSGLGSVSGGDTEEGKKGRTRPQASGRWFMVEAGMEEIDGVAGGDGRTVVAVMSEGRRSAELSSDQSYDGT